ncbi:MAG TPA: porin [Flavipsychrobacter sp.]|nr:porin [Flavipsychrobacter sp.]
MNKLLFFILLSVAVVTTAAGQTDSSKRTPSLNSKSETKPKWFDKLALRGYLQVRYNRLLETNPDLKCEQCDKSMGEDGGLFIRRARIYFFGQIHERVYIYIQPDFASAASSTGLNFGQIRDAYFDLGFDKKNEFRARVGQSKIPYGFINMQSSQNRLPLDRDDGLNSAASNERDMGVFLYWAPQKIRKRFASLVADGLKGSGDYGVFAFGVYNGQTANKPELNNEMYMVARATYPFKIGKKQIIEPGIQAYTGKYTLAPDQLSKGVKSVAGNTYLDRRVAATFVLYPQPFGIQAEYNVGKGPEFNNATDSIETRNISGGYAILSYMLKFKNQLIYPFVRGQYYAGGKKFELDARSYTVNEFEAGVEWKPLPNFELVATYNIARRRFEDFVKQNNVQQGRLLRLQAQINF